jgi:polysaccharide export outer membrane protein
MPTSGPQSWDVAWGQRDPQSLPYALVKVTPPVLGILANAAPRLHKAFTDSRPPEKLRFGIGDVLRVTIFEARAGGLFLPEAGGGQRQGNFITVPEQEVDSDGDISIPYAGAIRAAGRTAVHVQQAIMEALKDRALEPQVVVSLALRQTSLITLLGDLRPQRLPALPAGERLLDTIARGGGPANQGYDEWVLLERARRRETVPLAALLYEPADNIWSHPGDTVYLYRQPQTFLAFGAVRVIGNQIPFDQWRLSLAEAIGKSGGLSDTQADPGAVFLYRGEARKVAQKLGVNVSGFNGPIIPIIYTLNMRDPAVYFLATQFEMRNKDVIYVSNAVSVEVTKFLQYLQTINGTIQDPLGTAIGAYTLKGLIAGTGTSNVLVGVPSATTH